MITLLIPLYRDAARSPSKVDQSRGISSEPEELCTTMQVDMPPPSPPVPIEPGPSMQDIDKSTQFPADEPTDSSLPKEDVERAILIECSEIHAQALSKDWEAVAALGQAMDLKVSAMCAIDVAVLIHGSTASSF